MNPTYTQQNPYMAHLATLEQARNQFQGQTFQTIRPLQPQVQCYFVSSTEEMGQIQPQMNTVYIGWNKAKQEIYIRQINNDGLIDSDIYVKAGSKQEQTGWDLILTRLDNIETKLNGGKHESHDERTNPTGNANGPVGTIPTNPTNGLV